MATTFLAAAIILALLSLVEALHSLWDGVRNSRRYVARTYARGRFSPPVTLIVPCKGVDRGLRDNLAAYLALDYPDARLLIVTGEPSDPCVAIVHELRARVPMAEIEILFSGIARERGQKVQNLLHAVSHLRDRDLVIAFGDSDIRPRRDWLRHLIDPLGDPGVAVSTGFRWYLPRDGRFSSVLRSVWNAGIAGLMRPDDSPFAWGGAMAIRRDTFETLQIASYWEHALSDDYALSRAMRDHGLPILFRPQALSFTHEDSTFGELLDWTLRQLLITRVYHPRLWKLGFASEALNNLAFWGGLVTLTIGLVAGLGGPAIPILGALLAGVYLLRCLKASIRLRVVIRLFPEHGRALRKHRWAYVLWGPLGSLITMVGLIRSLFSNEIEWRGIRYRMVSPVETVVVNGSE